MGTSVIRTGAPERGQLCGLGTHKESRRHLRTLCAGGGVWVGQLHGTVLDPTLSPHLPHFSPKGPAAILSGASRHHSPRNCPSAPQTARSRPLAQTWTPASIVAFSVSKVFGLEPESPLKSGGLRRLTSTSLTLSFLTFEVETWIPASEHSEKSV